MLMPEGVFPAFIALLAVASVVPILPAIQGHTEQLSDAAARRYSLWALLGGNAVGVIFVFIAPPLFRALSLTVNDLQVAGGIILLVYATHDILFSRIRRSERGLASDEDLDLGSPVAPLGVPILVGPATLSTLLVLSELHGALPVLASFGAVGLTNAVALIVAAPVLRMLGEGPSRAVGKVMSLVLATLGAGMLRAGLLLGG